MLEKLNIDEKILSEILGNYTAIPVGKNQIKYVEYLTDIAVSTAPGKTCRRISQIFWW